MPRVRISEYKAKRLLSSFLHQDYKGIEINSGNSATKISQLDLQKRYVVKVDQGVKKRNKLGLVAVNITRDQISEKIKEFQDKGYSQFLIEDFVEHDAEEEKFLALERVRDGILCHYSKHGGVNIEEDKNNIVSLVLNSEKYDSVSKELEISSDQIAKITEAFEKLYLSFLETNPFIVRDQEILLLDLAVEVDSAADFFVNGQWSSSDFIDTQKNQEPEEIEIKKLAERSSASFKFVVLNPNGSIFTIFSGGGASIVLADEINNIGKGHDLADYAEYSGGPTEEETYIFTKNIISLALRSPADGKKIYIAGGVANFTDIRATFKGVIKALSEQKDELKKQNIKVYVRRGGPYQEEGLAIMKDFLEKSGLLGEVMGPDRILTEVITNN